MCDIRGGGIFISVTDVGEGVKNRDKCGRRLWMAPQLCIVVSDISVSLQ